FSVVILSRCFFIVVSGIILFLFHLLSRILSPRWRSKASACACLCAPVCRRCDSDADCPAGKCSSVGRLCCVLWPTPLAGHCRRREERVSVSCVCVSPISLPFPFLSLHSLFFLLRFFSAHTLALP